VPFLAAGISGDFDNETDQEISITNMTGNAKDEGFEEGGLSLIR